jgi:adenylate cyclase
LWTTQPEAFNLNTKEGEKIKGRFFCRELDCVQVKGKKKPVKIYELIGRDGVPGNLVRGVEYFHQGLGFYRRQEWDRAERRCFGKPSG